MVCHSCLGCLGNYGAQRQHSLGIRGHKAPNTELYGDFRAHRLGGVPKAGARKAAMLSATAAGHRTPVASHTVFIGSGCSLWLSVCITSRLKCTPYTTMSLPMETASVQPHSAEPCPPEKRLLPTDATTQ